jgi:hypothetical protein
MLNMAGASPKRSPTTPKKIGPEIDAALAIE